MANTSAFLNPKILRPSGQSPSQSYLYSRIFYSPEAQSDYGSPDNITPTGCLAIARLGRDVWNAWRTAHPPKIINKQWSNVADFSGCDFRNNAIDFSGFLFGNAANFSGAKFGDNARFAEARFGDNALFNNTVWGNGASWDGASFGSQASFENMIVGMHASFRGTVFSRTSSFFNSSFGGWSSFEHAKFGQWLNFANAQFGPAISFINAHFESNASFENCQFSDSINFSRAIFHHEATFAKTSFGDWATFDEAQFGSMASFENTIWSDGASFEGSAFSSEASFASATFSGDVNFTGLLEKPARLRKTVPQSGANILDGGEDELGFHSTPNGFFSINFSDCHFAGEVDFSGRVFAGHADFSEAVFAHPPQFHNCQFQQALHFEQTDFPLPAASLRHLRAYRAIKLALIRHSALQEAQDFYRLEMEEESSMQQGFLQRLPYLLYKWISDYGLSFARPLTVIGALILLSFIPYSLIHSGLANLTGSGIAWQSWSVILGFSVVQSFPLVNDEAARSLLFGSQTGGSLLVFIFLQRLFSLLMWGVVLLGLRNRFKIF